MMKMVVLVFAVLTAANAFTQTSRPDVISRPANSDDRVDAVESSTYTLNEVSEQLRDLQDAVDDTLPMLKSVTGTNAAPQGGALGQVLGEILRGGTNETARSESTRRTNLLGGILSGVLGTNSPTAGPTSTNSNTVNDLVALRHHLQSISPILKRLNEGEWSDSQITGERDSSTELEPTGRERSRRY